MTLIVYLALFFCADAQWLYSMNFPFDLGWTEGYDVPGIIQKMATEGL